MGLLSIPQIFTYFSYIFVVAAYAIKIYKMSRMPLHLRWELYPVIHDKGYRYGGSYFEELEWWKKPLKRNIVRSVIFKIKDYFTFPNYFSRNKFYWFGLYPWHIGFYAIVGFHIMSFLGALIILTSGVSITAGSPYTGGVFIYFLTLVLAAGSFVLGAIGSVILLLKRLLDRDLRAYASASNYVNYIFFLIVFLSGLASWFFSDPTLSSYRDFWVNLITFRYHEVEPLMYVHIILFSLFLIYLPFTRSTHYITKIFAFFEVLWDDRPSLGDVKLENSIKRSLSQPVTWSASHIKRCKTWSEIASGISDDDKGNN